MRGGILDDVMAYLRRNPALIVILSLVLLLSGLEVAVLLVPGAAG